MLPAIWSQTESKASTSTSSTSLRVGIAEIAVTPNSASCIYADGAVWVTTPERNLLTRVDSKTNQVVATLPFGPADSEGGIATSPDSVWMLTDKKGILSRIDPASNKVAVEIAVTPNSASCIYAEGAVWITTPEKKLLTRVDPKSDIETIDGCWSRAIASASVTNRATSSGPAWAPARIILRAQGRFNRT